MIKGSIQEDITIVNIHAPKIEVPQYIGIMLTDIKGEINKNSKGLTTEDTEELVPQWRKRKARIPKVCLRAARHSAVRGLRFGHCDGMATLGNLGHSGSATRKLNGRSIQAQCSFMYQGERKWLRLVALLLERTGIPEGLSATFLFPTLSGNSSEKLLGPA